MPKLETLIEPERSAVITMELQRGVVGDLASIPALQKSVAESRIIPNTAKLVAAAREHGIRVVHCTAAFRRDRAGSFRNVPMVKPFLESPDYLVTGSEEADVVPELGPEPSDLVTERLHGMSPFTSTSLDAWLRSSRITTVIATGVSLNVGIFGLTIEAINRGYDVVIPTDCVAGHPLDYGQLVLQNSLAGLSKLTTADAIIAAWEV